MKVWFRVHYGSVNDAAIFESCQADRVLSVLLGICKKMRDGVLKEEFIASSLDIGLKVILPERCIAVDKINHVPRRVVNHIDGDGGLRRNWSLENRKNWALGVVATQNCYGITEVNRNRSKYESSF